MYGISLKAVICKLTELFVCTEKFSLHASTVIALTSLTEVFTRRSYEKY